MLVLGGAVLLFVDKWFNATDDTQEVSYKQALNIGLFQVIAMIPGVSRSAATIIGGLAQKLSRKTAAEFSFFLAVPTMFAATVYKMYKYEKDFGFKAADITIMIIGNIVAFIVAILAIRGFVNFLTKHGFKVFGYYRIVVGLVIIALYLAGYQLKVV
jgi:undecaprenyl-diphosphatase